jgi:hypothetical protein
VSGSVLLQCFRMRPTGALSRLTRVLFIGPAMVAVWCPSRLEFVSRTSTVSRERGPHPGFSRELAGCEQFIRPHRRVLKQRGGARKNVLHVHKPEQIKRQRTRRRPRSYFDGTNHCIVQKCWPPQCTFSKPMPTRT